MKVRAAPEVLADEDLLEMVNAGLVKMTIVDDYVAEFWKQVFPAIVLNRGRGLKTDGQTAMMIRKNSPQLRAELNAFLATLPGRLAAAQRRDAEVPGRASSTRSGPHRRRSRRGSRRRSRSSASTARSTSSTTC